jgi:hypothetical protein
MSLLTDLIAYWKLDESSGNAIDAHDDNDLTQTNDPGTATGILNDARDFERGSSELFSIADNDDLSVGDIDFTISAWVKLENKAADEMVIAAKSSGSQGDYFLEYNNDADRFRFLVFTGLGFSGSASVLADTLGSPAEATWYFVVAWHDAAANTLNIQVNNGTADTTSHSGGVNNNAGTLFFVGGDPFTNYWDGLIDEVGFWKRTLTSGERTSLYNSGSGLAYESFDLPGEEALEGSVATGAQTAPGVNSSVPL